MISTMSAWRAAELRALLDAGALRNLGRVETLHGLSSDAELAARIVLAHLNHLAGLEEAGVAQPARWQAVEEDLDRLHTAVSLALGAAAVPV